MELDQILEQQAGQQTNSGPVTIDDVRAALGDVAPGDTNAGKLRAVIGRGSYGTIQKHLDALRAQRIAAAQPAAEQSIPKAPAEAVEMLWAAAWGAAQTKTLARLEALSAERDGLFALSQAHTADIASLTEQMDMLEGTLQSQAEALKVAQETAMAEVWAAKDALQVQADVLTETRAALTKAESDVLKAQSDAEQAAAIAVRDALIERQSMQRTIEMLTEQIAQSRALDIARAMQPSASAAPDTQTSGKEKK